MAVGVELTAVEAPAVLAGVEPELAVDPCYFFSAPISRSNPASNLA